MSSLSLSVYLSSSDCPALSFSLALSLRMSLSDFRLNFDFIEACHLGDDTLSSAQRPWHCTMHHGRWVDYKSAGGPHKGGINSLACCCMQSYTFILYFSVSNMVFLLSFHLYEPIKEVPNQ